MRAGGSQHSQALAGVFFALVAAVLAGSAKPGIRGYDAQHRFAQLAEWRSAAGGGEVADEGATADEGASEAIDRKYGAALPLLAMPLYVAGEALDAWSGDADGSGPRSAVAQFNHLVTLAFCAWIWRWHRSRLGASAANAAAGVLLVLATSWILAHGKDFYSEVLWSALACVFLDAVTASRPVSAGLVAAMLVWVNPALAPVAALAAVAAAAGGPGRWAALGAAGGTGRRTALGAAGFGMFCGLLANGIENVVERGRFLDGGYGEETFLWQPARMLDLLVSPGRGLLLFAPACLAIPAVLMRTGATPVDDYVRRFFRGAAVFIAGLVVLYGSWCWWCGGYFFGPRFLLAGSVLASLAILPAWSRARSDLGRGVLVFLVAASAFTAWFGLTAGHRFAEDCRFAADASHRAWNESPFWIFTQPPEVWRELLTHRGTIALAAGLTCGTMLRRFLRSPEKEWK